MKLSLYATTLSVLISSVTAFAPQTRPSLVAGAGRLHMSEEKSPSLQTNSGSEKKKIAYDEISGRFFESGDENECIPDDEYCAVDEETGNMIRLTVAEKERIFLDSLQVSKITYYRKTRDSRICPDIVSYSLSSFSDLDCHAVILLQWTYDDGRC